MPFYVYIILSKKDFSYYKGYSENPLERLRQHNNKESTYTSAKIPWELVYLEELPTKREALIREKNIKKATLERIAALINHPKNIAHRFLG
ncbi:MAG TPA: GIY-YIG nuclease family protein [Puia sp.]|nr:GIY-YIG nuclease family protein [Puia sp.]